MNVPIIFPSNFVYNHFIFFPFSRREAARVVLLPPVLLLLHLLLAAAAAAHGGVAGGRGRHRGHTGGSRTGRSQA